MNGYISELEMSETVSDCGEDKSHRHYYYHPAYRIIYHLQTDYSFYSSKLQFIHPLQPSQHKYGTKQWKVRRL
jgi:hypothetical protein